MALKLIISLNAFVFICLIPFLEINDTHVFNPDWPAHARLHEVWQLGTNGLLSILAIILAWRTRQPGLSSLISILINIPFLFACLTQAGYGGSMTHSDGSELLVMGVNPAFGILALLTVLMSALAGQRVLISARHAP